MSINIATLTRHPERLGKDTLYELRSLLARYPYYQPARLLLLKNLYLLHDPTFDEELRRAAVYITERQRLFDLTEGPHYQLRDDQAAEHEAAKHETAKHEVAKHESSEQGAPEGDRTAALIDSFLDQLPGEEGEETQPKPQDQPVVKRKPTPADATIDYVAYLMEAGDEVPRRLPNSRARNSSTTSSTRRKVKFLYKTKPSTSPRKKPWRTKDRAISPKLWRVSTSSRADIPRHWKLFSDYIWNIQKKIVTLQTVFGFYRN